MSGFHFKSSREQIVNDLKNIYWDLKNVPLDDSRPKPPPPSQKQLLRSFYSNGEDQDELDLLQYSTGLTSSSLPKYNYYIQNEYHY